MEFISGALDWSPTQKFNYYMIQILGLPYYEFYLMPEQDRINKLEKIDKEVLKALKKVFSILAFKYHDKLAKENWKLVRSIEQKKRVINF